MVASMDEEALNARTQVSGQQNVAAPLRNPDAKAFRDALKLLHSLDPMRRGLYAFLVDLFERRATIGTINHWRIGTRFPPDWARQIVAGALQNIRWRIDAAEAMAHKMPNGPGYRFAKKKRAAEAALKSYPQEN